jgi:hypothetical protein
MRRQREDLDLNPYRLISTLHEKNRTDYNMLNKARAQRTEANTLDEEITNITSGTGTDANRVGASPAVKPISESFGERYTDEIASVSKLKEYEKMGTKYKSLLLKEAKQLQSKFKEEVVEANRMERTVEGITGMLSEFVQMIQTQSVLVEDVHDQAVDATGYVKQTDEELLLTLQRSQSHSRNMVFLCTILAVMLLALDYITP